MLNDKGLYSEDLSLFGGQVLDIAAGNLPKGSSPQCSDMFFSGQYVATRPALSHLLSSHLVGGANILSHDDYPLPKGQSETVMLYDDGSIWTNNVQVSGQNAEQHALSCDAAIGERRRDGRRRQLGAARPCRRV